MHFFCLKALCIDILLVEDFEAFFMRRQEGQNDFVSHRLRLDFPSAALAIRHFKIASAGFTIRHFNSKCRPLEIGTSIYFQVPLLGFGTSKIEVPISRVHY